MAYADEVTGESTLVGYWRLGESSGTTAEDETANNRDGTIGGSPTLGATGIPGAGDNKAITFDGSDDVVTITGNSAFWVDATNGVAYELWYKGTDTGNNAGGGTVGTTCGLFAANTGLSAKRFVIGIDADGKVRCHTEDSYLLTGASTTVVNDNAWHHIVLHIEGGTYDTTLYVDGASEATNTSPNDAGSGTPNLTIGDNPRATGGEAAGIIDEVAVYKGSSSATALSAARVLAHYEAGTSAAMPTPTAVAAVATIPTPSVSAGDAASVSPATVAAVTAVPEPTITATADAAITATTVAATATVPAPKVVAATDDYEAALLALDPRVYWRLGETSGTTAADASGNSTTGTYTGTYTQAADSLLNVGTDDAVSFTGGGYVFRNSGFSHSGDWSQAVWYKSTGTGGTIAQSFGAIKISQDGSGKIVGGTNTTSGSASVTSTGTYNDGNPHFVVVTYQASSNTVSLYIDGDLEDTATTSADITTTTQLKVGSNNVNDDYLTGTVDEFAVFLSLLSAQNVEDLYFAAGYSSLEPPVPATVVATTVAIPAPTVAAGQQAQITPTVIAAVSTVPAPLVGAGNANIVAVAVAAVAAVPVPSLASTLAVTTWTADASQGTGGICEWSIVVEVDVVTDPTAELGWYPIRTNRVTWPAITVDGSGRPVEA